MLYTSMRILAATHLHGRIFFAIFLCHDMQHTYLDFFFSFLSYMDLPQFLEWQNHCICYVLSLKYAMGPTGMPIGPVVIILTS
jgi:hypothetical protein